MLWHWHLLSSCLMLIWFCPSSGLCPSECICRLDDKGQRKVSCLQGGMLESIPVSNMDPGMDIIEISAPNNNWNSLTIGPIFQQFKNLEIIRIWRSNIIQIGMHSFWGVPSVKHLDLRFNNLTVLFDHNFRGLLNLIELNLDDNEIDRLPSGVFKHLTELRTLTLERNRLEDLVPRLFLKLGKLQVLKLSGNQLLELNPEVFKDVLELRVLECRACGLSRINTQIYHLLPYLTHLDLGNNRMQFIAADEFSDLRRLRSLKLDGNQLPVVLEKTFINQKELRTLCLARNRLAKITNTAFLNLSNLIELDISYNKLQRLENVIFHPVAESLRKLLLSGNHFPNAVLRVVLHTVIKIRELAIANMGISQLPAGILPDHLKALNLSGNNLTNLTLQDLPHQLVELDISRNKFRGLDERVVIRLEQLDEIHLSGNPWSCELCYIQPLLNHINKTSVFQNVTCASPKALAGRSLGSLKLYEVNVCDTNTNSEGDDSLLFGNDTLGLIIGGVCLLLFLIVCIIFVVCSCCRRRINNINEEAKRAAEREAIIENPTAVFGDKGEISFKFPLDLTVRKVSVSTIDGIKKETQLHTLPNGTGI